MSVRATKGQQGRIRTGRVGAQAGGGPAPSPGRIMLENGTDALLIETVGFLLLETAAFSPAFSMDFS